MKLQKEIELIEMEWFSLASLENPSIEDEDRLIALNELLEELYDKEGHK